MKVRISNEMATILEDMHIALLGVLPKVFQPAFTTDISTLLEHRNRETIAAIRTWLQRDTFADYSAALVFC